MLNLCWAEKVLSQEQPPVPKDYQKYFAHFEDNRSLPEKVLNSLDVTLEDFGRSFALIAGVYEYPKFRTDPVLEPAKADIRKLEEYLREQEYFDEIVVLKNEDMNEANLKYFLQGYFAERIKKFPKSRFLFAYSGHGFNDDSNGSTEGYILTSASRNLKDKAYSINLKSLKVLLQEVYQKSAHHSLVLINSCYSGTFLGRQPFGDDEKPTIPLYRGAHGITASSMNEYAYGAGHEMGTGSVFYEALFASLNGFADTYPPATRSQAAGDGIITVEELFGYMAPLIRDVTNQNQNPHQGDLLLPESRGSFIFLNRFRQINTGNTPKWRYDPETEFGNMHSVVTTAELLAKAKTAYRQKNYEEAISLFETPAQAGDVEAQCVFRRKSAGKSDLNRPPNPIHSGHRIRFNSAT